MPKSYMLFSSVKMAALSSNLNLPIDKINYPQMDM